MWGGAVDDDIVGEPHRQVFDSPAQPALGATEHQVQVRPCGVCGGVTRAAFPEGMNALAQYGERISAAAVYLQDAHFLPEEWLAEVFQDLFRVPVCAATLTGMTRKAAQGSRGCTICW